MIIDSEQRTLGFVSPLAPDTIYALSSGRPPAAIAVVRVSGPRAGFALESLIGRRIAPREAKLATLRDPSSGDMIDRALVLWFPAPASETGEDIAEFQLHGGKAVIAAALAALGRIKGLRHAEAGEFTRRALANGQLDLTAVEGLADLIGADTDAQRRQALAHLNGLLGKRAETWRQRIVSAQALLEAALDFSDEGDVPPDTRKAALAVARELAAEIKTALGDSRRGERLRDGLTVAIAGPVNAGKSSIFNWILKRDAAIVSPHAGTTRDVLEVHLDLGGYPLTLLDTAGVRASHDPVEQEGIRRARLRAEAADLVLWVEDAAEGCREAGERAAQARPETWGVINKVDRLSAAARAQLSAAVPASGGVFLTSAASGEGLAGLLDALERFAERSLSASEPALVARARQREVLKEALDALKRAQGISPGDEELTAEELRLAGRALGRLLGRIDVEDVLEAIFKDFCIGK